MLVCVDLLTSYFVGCVFIDEGVCVCIVLLSPPIVLMKAIIVTQLIPAIVIDHNHTHSAQGEHKIRGYNEKI